MGVLGLVGPLLIASPAAAVEFGDAKEVSKEELIAGIHRDVGKVDKSIAVTKELIDKARTRPYLPDLLFRMAELYVEKSRLIFFLALERAGQGTQVAVAPEARLLKEKAISIYEGILRQFPRFADGDKVLFFEAHEFRELGQYDEMRKTYQRLIDTYPASSYRHQARLVLGDHHFDGGELEEAEEHYQRILQEPETFAHQTARYKLAWIRINEEKMKEALVLLHQIVASELDPDAADSVEQRKLVSVKREALSDMVFVYTEVEDPERALEYFEPLCSTKSEYLRVLGRLANRLFVQEKWLPAARVYRTLVRLTGDADRNVDQVVRIFEASQAAKNLTGADKDVDALAVAMGRYLTDWRFTKRQRDDVAHDFETMGRDVATKLQAEATKTGNKGNLSVAADAYAAYLRAFPESAQASDMMVNQAESLFGSERYLEAAQVYEQLAARLSPGDERRETMYSAIVAYFEALKDVEKMRRYETLLTREGLKGAGARFVDEHPQDKRVANVRFNIAKLNYDQGHFRDAVDLFSAFAEAYPGHKDAAPAGHLALDALDKLEDFEGMVALGRRLIDNTQLDLGFRNEVQEIVKNASYKLVREVTVEAGTRIGATDEQVDDELLEYAKKHGGTKLGEVALLNAFALYVEKGNLSLMEKAAERFAADYPESPKNKEILLDKAKTYLNVGRFDEAAKLFEGVAVIEQDPMAATDLGKRAARLYMALGEWRRAVDSWATVLPRLSRDERFDAVSATLEALVTLEDWRALQLKVEEIGKSDKKVIKDPLVALRLGQAQMRMGRTEDAKKQLKAALKGEEEVAAEARYRLMELDLQRFENIQFAAGKDPGVVVAERLDLIDKMESDLFEIFDYGSPRWSIAALLRVGQANESLSSFLAGVPAPPGLNAAQVAQFQQAIAEQAKAIADKAAGTYEACTQKAYELDAFNRYLLGCLHKGKLPPADRLPGRVHLGPAQRAGLRVFEERLARNSKDKEALLAAAGIYLKAGDLRMARILAGRVLEVDNKDHAATNLSGLATLLLGDPAVAIFDLMQAQSQGSTDALINLSTLYWMYGDNDRARGAMKKLGDVRTVDFASAGVHPKGVEMARALGFR